MFGVMLSIAAVKELGVGDYEDRVGVGKRRRFHLRGKVLVEDDAVRDLPPAPIIPMSLLFAAVLGSLSACEGR